MTTLRQVRLNAAALAHLAGALARGVTLRGVILRGVTFVVVAFAASIPCVALRAQGNGAYAVILPPRLDLTWRSGVPDARGDGPFETRPGLGVRVTGHAQYRTERWGIRLGPELSYSGAQDYQTFPGGDPARHVDASPWYHGAHSADLPSHKARTARLWPGESSAWVRLGTLWLIASTAQPDWSTGQGESIVLGRSAPGVPRVEARFRRELSETRMIEFRWFTGVVRESDRFDTDPANDARPLAGVRADFFHDGTLGVAAGISRMVMDGRREANVLDGAGAPFAFQRRDSLLEMLSIDIGLTSPLTGTIAWVELARQTPLGSFRSLLESPVEGLAFRFGVSQTLAASRRAVWSGTLEFVLLDQPAQRDGIERPDLYTSGTVIHGWTHHGQPLGSGLGPGGQRQFASISRAGSTWDLGAFAERARWNDGAMLRLSEPASDRHDVTIQVGLEASRSLGRYRVGTTASVGRRLNYLFRGASAMPDQRAVDVRLVQLGLSIAPMR